MSASADEIITEMGISLKQLVANAEELLKISSGAVSEDVLAPLQGKQEELVSELVAMDKKLDSLLKGEAADIESSAWKKIQQHLDEFQKLNKSFIDNLSVRKGLIQFDLKDIKAQRRQLEQLQDVYTQGPKRQQGNKKKGNNPKGSRVNHVS